MNKKDYMIVLGTAHLESTSGKRSPDGRLREAVYSREIVEDVETILLGYSYNVTVDYRGLNEDANMRAVSNTKNQTTRELIYRARQVNAICRKFPKKTLYVSIHVDAMGADGQWHDARGWSVRVSPQASSNSKVLANCLFDAAKKYGLKTRQPMQTQKYWEQSLYVLNQTDCPAVLTENLFQDNREDVEYLLSDVGRHQVARIHAEGIIEYLNKIG